MMAKQQEAKANEDELVCPECGSKDFIKTVSDYVCRNCGICVAPIFVSTQFVDRNSDGVRSGSPESRRAVRSTSFRLLDVPPGEQRKKYHRLRRAENSEYDALEEQKSRILAILTSLNLSERDKDGILFEIKKRYMEAKRANKKVSNIFLIVAAITIKFMQNRKRPENLVEVVKVFKSFGCKLSAKAVRDYILENNIVYRPAQPAQFIPKYMASMRNSEKIKNKLREFESDEATINKVLLTIEKIALKLSYLKIRGKKPSVFSASCIFLASELVGKKFFNKQIFSKEDISRLCKVPSTTLSSHYKSLKEHLKLENRAISR